MPLKQLSDSEYQAILKQIEEWKIEAEKEQQSSSGALASAYLRINNIHNINTRYWNALMRHFIVNPENQTREGLIAIANGEVKVKGIGEGGQKEIMGCLGE